MRKKICFPCRHRVKEDTLGLALCVLCGNAFDPRVPQVVSHSCHQSLCLNVKVFDSQTLFPHRWKGGLQIRVLWHTWMVEISRFSSCLPRPAFYLCPNSVHIYMLTVCILALYNWIQAINYSPSPALSQPPESSLSLPSVSLVEFSSVHRGWLKSFLCSTA